MATCPPNRPSRGASTIITRSIGAGLLAGLALIAGALPVSASKPVPRARVIPSRVVIRGSAVVVASHLRPRTTVTLLLAVPNLAAHRVEQLLGATHADAHGNLRVTVSIPLVTTCGAASLYVITAQTAQHLHAKLTVTGCKAGKKNAGPPPPPKP